MRAKHLAATLAALTLTGPTLAQQTLRTLPETVVTATGVPTDPARLAAGVTVIDRRVIEERGYQTLADALAAVPGLRLVQLGGPGQVATVFMRGTNSNHVLVLRDGVPANDPSTPGGLFNFGDDLLDDIERIEIIRGPLAGIYGSSAIGGVINLITRRGGERPAGAVSAAAGTQRTVFGNGVVSGRLGAMDGMLAFGSLSTRGSNVIAPRIATNRGERDGQTVQALAANAGLWLNETTRLGLIARFRQSAFGYDNFGVFDGTDSIVVDDPNLGGRTRFGGAQATAETVLLGGRWRSTLSLARVLEDRRFTNRPDGIDPTASSGDDRYRAWRTDLRWTNTLALPDLPGVSALFASFGLAHTRDEAEVALRSGGGFALDVNAKTSTTGGHVGLQGTVLERLDLTLSVRHESPEDFEDKTTWRVGGVYRLPLPVPVRAFAAYGTGFKAPTLYDLFGVNNFGFRGNRNLRPERSTGWEAGLAAEVPGGALGLVTLQATYFETEIRDLIAFVFLPDFTSTQINRDKAEIRGVETQLTVSPSPRLSLTASYTWTEAQDSRTGLQLARRPKNSGALSVRWQPVERLVLSPELLLFGPAAEDRFAAYDDLGRAISVRTTNAGGAVFNLGARLSLAPGWEAFFIGRNLTNSRYEPANGYVTPQAGLFGGLTARW